MQDAKTLESDLNFEMEDVMFDISPISGPNPKGPIREISSGTNRDDAYYTHDHTPFKVDKAHRKY
jgi:hypothetical protein